MYQPAEWDRITNHTEQGSMVKKNQHFFLKCYNEGTQVAQKSDMIVCCCLEE